MELRDIAGFPGYKISDDGRVWSDNGRWGRCGWLKGRLSTNGYLKVVLCVNGRQCEKLVHRLVAEAFLPNPEGLPEINHKDECKTNNIVDNLEWCTRKYNNNYGTHNERALAKYNTPEAHAKTKATKQRLYGKPVAQLTLDGQEIARFCCMREAARQTGFDQGGIGNVCRGKLKTYKGYRWRYLTEEDNDMTE